ncbi:hypothetical protein B0H34DRAFT_719435 [Crassisporium funariophilum]|nr:hypothetical protein B0H34DRAFT_719435 [Crassisporium funariophilum]
MYTAYVGRGSMEGCPTRRSKVEDCHYSFQKAELEQEVNRLATSCECPFRHRTGQWRCTRNYALPSSEKWRILMQSGNDRRHALLNFELLLQGEEMEYSDMKDTRGLGFWTLNVNYRSRGPPAKRTRQQNDTAVETECTSLEICRDQALAIGTPHWRTIQIDPAT